MTNRESRTQLLARMAAKMKSTPKQIDLLLRRSPPDRPAPRSNDSVES